ncbi:MULTISPECIES: sigma-70 family RNA polymerase sigma factor [Bradyrhizobium]|uniref:sigma-70 family RNA polymerase sigma factor n=1 Tax=Bradyrhizobium TaxID=374 RepID=UPI001B8A5460|nr:MULTISPECIES: sigma-70 family RNA polymerase sigma factor [Bradyrhizobium]MBR0971305.1 sigma-70 family RNA polymerase sigma factor [Bradyrhizobium japonicum]
MSITEGRQPGETARLRRPRSRTSSSGHAPTRLGVSPCKAGNGPKSLQGPSSAVIHDELVFAVCRTGESEPAPGRESRNRAIDLRFVQEDACDEMLLKNVAEGDKAAMHIIFARHRERVSRFIRRRVRNPAIVDDLVSQVFLDVWRSANRFESRARVSTWLLSIARFKAISSWRERTHDDIDQVDACGIVDVRDTPDVALDRKDTEGILRACIDKLSPVHREIIDLFYYRENSVAEVSGIIGIPRATVKSRIFYARKQLARILVDAGFDAKSA